jgi:hypothetical protein
MPVRLGLSHLRYDHQRRPTLLEVKCPQCHGKAAATEPCYAEGVVLVGEGSCPHWDKSDWRVACSSCLFRSTGRSYFDLGELFYQAEARGVVLWAWNREHLVMLYDLLSNRPVDNHRYAWFATYAQKDWLKGSRRKSLAEAVERLLNG